MGLLFSCAPLLLGACYAGDGQTRPTLAADARWDAMAAKRQEPLPREDDVSEIAAEPEAAREEAVDPVEFRPPNLDAALTLDEYRGILSQAEDRYEHIAGKLDSGFDTLVAGKGSPTDREELWRTMQLHLSRLATLQKNVIRALDALEPAKAADEASLSPEDERLHRLGDLLKDRIAFRLEDARVRVSLLEP